MSVPVNETVLVLVERYEATNEGVRFWTIIICMGFFVVLDEETCECWDEERDDHREEESEKYRHCFHTIVIYKKLYSL